MPPDLRRVLFFAPLLFFGLQLHAGGPRFVAGTTYFNSSTTGQPILWANGVVSYFVDQGDLSASVTNASATATVAAAAATWNAVPTAAVSILAGGSLAEDVNGTNVYATPNGITMPTDIESTATSSPVAVVFDADGSVIDAFYGLDASDPDDCIDNGAIARVDNLAPTANIVHAVILINGLCTGTAAQLKQIQFQLIRAFGRVLGLDWSQANDAVLFGPGLPSLQQLEGWPLMRPIDLNCNQLSIECVPDPMQLRADDTASLSRLYPVTASNLVHFPAGVETAAATVSIHGSIRFRRGQGMQGVNVIARPISPGLGLPDDRYPVASVSGFLFTGNRGNPVTGPTDQAGDALLDFGSLDPLVEGSYDLSGIPLPPGQNAADYQITLEPINPLYSGLQSVGPYALGSPTPSGTMATAMLRGLTAGMSMEQDFAIPDSAGDLGVGWGGTASAPASIPPQGEWQSRIPETGGVSWFALPVLGGRHLTIEAQALDQQYDQEDAGQSETATPSQDKLRTVIGIWNAADPTASPPVVATVAPYNGAAVGMTALAVDTIADGDLLAGIADQRGDGRPDYIFHGRLLYASQVYPTVLPLAGGVITITGSGFRPGMLVSFGGGSLAAPIPATVTNITPTLVVAMAPPQTAPTGSVDLVLTDPATNGIAVIASGISYGAATNDVMSIVTPLPASLGVGVPAAFTVRVYGPDQITPVGYVPVTFSFLAGSARFNTCGSSPCIANTTGDGFATIQVIPTAAGLITVQAALTNGDTLQAQLNGAATPAIATLSAPLFIAPNGSFTWLPAVELWNGQTPAGSVPVNWSGSGASVTVPSSTTTNSAGIASAMLALGPWPPGTAFTLTACVPNTNVCVQIPAYAVHPQSELLSPVSGTAQQLVAGQSPAPVTMRLVAPAGQPIVAGTVTFTGEIRAWTPPCPITGPCSPGSLLGTFSQEAGTAADGSATFTPNLTSTPQIVTGIATAGSTSTASFQIDVHP